MTGMASPMDWDFEALRHRMIELNPPPFAIGNSAVGQHCTHCPKAKTETCGITCAVAYRDRYGIEPPAS